MLRGITAYVRRHHIALLALFFALGGTAFAAGNALLPKNSVGSAQVINGSLQKGDLSGKAVKALKGNKGLRGTQGTPGPAGPRGATGPQGPATGPAGGALAGNYPNPTIADAAVKADALGATTQVVSSTTAITAGANATVTVTCPTGSQVLSGGGGASSFGVFNVESFQSGNGWLWVAHNSDAVDRTIFATAVCLLKT